MAIYVDEKELIAAHNSGDTSAFEELVREHRAALYRHAKRLLICNESAEDAVQETLVRAYRALPTFGGDYQLGSWLHRILRNVCIDEANRRKKDVEKTSRIASLPGHRIDSPSVEEELRLDFDDSKLKEALNSLSDPYREALVMRFVDDLEYGEVASRAGVSEENARARISRARSFMRATLKGVAAFPLFLFGILKRGEKAAAALTSSGDGSPAGILTGSTSNAVSISSALAPGASAVSDVAVFAASAAPTIMPVIAKAAVGIGLAAAVFTPTNDSAVYQAVTDMRTAGVSEFEIEKDEVVEISDPVTIEKVQVDAGKLAPIEDPPNSAVSVVNGELVVSATVDVEESVSESQDLVSAWADNSLDSFLGSVVIEEMSARSAGPNRLIIAGNISLSVGNQISKGYLDSSSEIYVALKAEESGNRRLDGYLGFVSDDNSEFNIRIAGFALPSNNGVIEISGLYSVESSEAGLSVRSAFTGTLLLPDGDTSGSLDLTLNS